MRPRKCPRNTTPQADTGGPIFGELIGHMANTQYNFCAPARKVPRTNKTNIEKTVTTKAELVAAVKEAFAFCDPAYEMPSDAAMTEEVKFGTRGVAAGSHLQRRP